MQMRLELVLLPVSDPDAALAFYRDVMGFSIDVDHRAGDDFRVIQATPPGSSCSVSFGVGLTDLAPGAMKGLHLVVTDAVATADRLRAAGADVAQPRHMTAEGWAEGPHPERADFQTFVDVTDPDGNTWVLQEKGHSPA